jgi:hypothetical protein
MITVMITFRKSSTNSLDDSAVGYWLSRRRYTLSYCILFYNFCFWKTTKSALTVEEFWIMFLVLICSDRTESIRKVYTVSNREVLCNLIHYTARKGESFPTAAHKTQPVFMCVLTCLRPVVWIWIVYNGLLIRQFWYPVIMGLIWKLTDILLCFYIEKSLAIVFFHFSTFIWPGL